MHESFASCGCCHQVWRVQALPISDPFVLGPCPGCNEDALQLLPMRPVHMQRADGPVREQLAGMGLVLAALTLIYLCLVYR